MGFSTDAIHGGHQSEPVTGAVITPLYLTSTYAQEELGKNTGFTYGRTHNATRQTLERNIAILEKGKYGIAFSSGVAAIHALMSLVKAGDHIMVADNVYGGTYRLFELFMSNYGLDFSWIDVTNRAMLTNNLRPNTKMIFVESPTNPLLTLIDLKDISEFAKNNNLISVADNTFMSPYFQNPLEHGIDIVVHSTTKYLNGQSDIIGGIVITNNEEIDKRIRYTQNAVGAIPSPFDCWLTLRSTKTLAVRMDRHEKNAMAVAEYLSRHTSVVKVIYPGLKSHPQHELARNQMSGFGGMVSFYTRDKQTALDFFKRIKIFTLAESLGGVESLVSHPATMTHSSLPKEQREVLGITENLIRLSVGIEDIDDLLADLEHAL